MNCVKKSTNTIHIVTLWSIKKQQLQLLNKLTKHVGKRMQHDVDGCNKEVWEEIITSYGGVWRRVAPCCQTAHVESHHCIFILLIRATWVYLSFDHSLWLAQCTYPSRMHFGILHFESLNFYPTIRAGPRSDTNFAHLRWNNKQEKPKWRGRFKFLPKISLDRQGSCWFRSWMIKLVFSLAGSVT